ncbi:nucleotidyltransferase family protein [Robiginitalea sp. IMCC44478]|uniref:nucleotidyltransferase family protein n=1 Tax=Robiginitalea sp. IMCC44478 TaxID=3459122 RepID=UPI0040424F30
MMNTAISCVILAAGASSRMGSPKALLPWGKQSVLRHLLGQVKKAGLEQLIVVSGASQQEIAQELPPGSAVLCHNTNWAKGMGSSISQGVLCMKQDYPDSEGLLVLLADQPLVNTMYLKRMIHKFRENPESIIATEYTEGPGVPALFPRRYFNELIKLKPGGGAKALMRNCNPGELVLLRAGDAGRDMDTPEAYGELKRIAGID